MFDDWKPDFPSWKDRFPDLVWWLDLNDRKVPRGEFGAETRPILDNTSGEVWDMRIDHRGFPMASSVRDANTESFRHRRSELKYEVWQYALIIWCLQKILFESWSKTECYQVIRHFWHNLSGQAPLTAQTVNYWVTVHKGHKKEGLLWP
jgi:hypothetical protein